jgi:hypothetical protein
VSDNVNPIKAANSGEWWVQVRGQAYGPYTFAQLSGFVAEGRVKQTTLVSDQKDGAWVEARRVIGLMANMRREAANDESGSAANVVVFAEIASGASTAFMASLEGMGHICELRPGFWLLRTHYSVGVLRNTLSQTLERGDRFVVVDASRDRLAWFNLGPEIDVRLARVWNAPIEAKAAR